MILSQTNKLPSTAWHFCIEPAERYALVDRFYRSQGYKLKTAVTETLFSAYIPGQKGGGEAAEIVAAARLVPQASGHFWLRNVLVAKGWRGQGLATALLGYALAQLAPKGCYCFALPHLDGFYTSLGFSLNPDHCPPEIAQKYQQYRARGRDWLLMGYLPTSLLPKRPG